jgi:hypothetical protein
MIRGLARDECVDLTLQLVPAAAHIRAAEQKEQWQANDRQEQDEHEPGEGRTGLAVLGHGTDRSDLDEVLEDEENDRVPRQFFTLRGTAGVALLGAGHRGRLEHTSGVTDVCLSTRVRSNARVGARTWARHDAKSACNKPHVP